MTAKTNEEVSNHWGLNGVPRDPVDNTNEGVFHTPIFNDQQMSAQCGTDATIGEEGNVEEEFNKILDVETLYADLLDLSSQDKPFEDVGKETQAFELGK